MTVVKKTSAVRIGGGLVVLTAAALWLFAGRQASRTFPAVSGAAPAAVAHRPAAAASGAEEAPPFSRRPITDEMRENLTDLDGIFSESELAFRHHGVLARVSESLDDYRSNRMLGIVKLQRALRDMRSSMSGEVFALFLQKLPPEQVDGAGAYRILFRTWGLLAGPVAVTTAMARLPENAVRLEAGREAMRSWAREDTAAAAKGVAALPDTYGKDYLIYALPDIYILADPLAAMAWADGLSPELRHNTFLHCMIKWLAVDPQAAQDYATALAGQPGAVDDGNGVVFSRTAGTLARKNVQEAAIWVEQLPADSKARRQAALGLIDWWGMADLEKAGAWLNRLGPSPVLDPAVDRFARDAVRIDPAGAAAWARTITDPAMRNNCLGAVLGYWAGRDAEGARRWAASNGYMIKQKTAR